MKKISLLFASCLLTLASCQEISQVFTRQGVLLIKFAEGTVPQTRAAAFPDTNEFILTVTSTSGTIVYDGKYGALDPEFKLDEGNYTVSARSCDFSAPLFDAPQYGDTQVAAVKSGKTTVVTLACVQMNCGVRLKIAPEFLTEYPDAVLYLKASSGRLMYSYSEKRIAYFLPGTVNLEMSEGDKSSTLFTRRLEAQQILTLTVNAGSRGSSGGVYVQVDTTRNWISDALTIGGGGHEGSGTSDALSVPVAKQHTGEEDVWVYGYIVGGDLTSSKCSFAPPFSSRTNIVIADKSSVKDKDACLSVQLAKGEVRDALNLVDHPENLGRQIFLKGDIVESYYGIPGIQNISEFEYK